MYRWIAVALGGAIGSVARHGINRLAHQMWPVWRFPIATMVVNLVGCFIIGLLAGLVATGRLPMRPIWREFVFVGLLGGFTTFSTFGLDTLTLIRSGDATPAVMNVAIHVVCGLAGVHVGLVLIERFGVVAR
jgi:CrcB protein